MAEQNLAMAQISVRDSAAATASASAARAWPWDPDQRVAARLAIASLQKFFIRSLSRNERVQLETLFCTVGALTGFAAQHALRQESLAAGRAETVLVAWAGGSNGLVGAWRRSDAARRARAS